MLYIQEKDLHLINISTNILKKDKIVFLCKS